MSTFLSSGTNFSKLFFVTVILFGCKKIDLNYAKITSENKLNSNRTVKQVIFSGQPDAVNTIVQVSTDKERKRFLIPLKTQTSNLHKYLLMEQNSFQLPMVKTYVISKETLTKKTDLFDIPFSKDGVSVYNNNSKDGTSSKLILKYKNKELNLDDIVSNTGSESEPISSYAPVPGGGGYCVDHWWVEWDEETGEILSITWLGSECYGCAATGTCSEGGGGGGGGGGSIDSTTLFNAAVDEYEGMHNGDFNLLSTVNFYYPVTQTSSVVKPIEWTVAQTSYFVVKCKSTTSAFYNLGTSNIYVDNLLNNTTTFTMLQSNFFWNIYWNAGNLSSGIITNNNANFTYGESNVTGNITYTAKSIWWAIFNSQPNMAADSDLIVYYHIVEGGS